MRTIPGARPAASRLRILVSGMLARVPHQGGAAWAVLQYILGLRQLGHEVFVVEPVDEHCPESVAYFDGIVAQFGLEATQVAPGELCPYTDLDVLLNISGMFRDESLQAIPVRIYLDLDPAFNQLWHEDGVEVGFDGHTHFFTVGQAIGAGNSEVPTCGLEWLTTLPPVVLERWPVGDQIVHSAFTTVGHWRSYGSIEHKGVHFGQKAHSLRSFSDLPKRTCERFQLALGIHPEETPDLLMLASRGWEVLDPRAVARTPAAYQEFVGGSRAEIGLAKSGYVASRSGWFSDRSACYLAAGRPVVAQDTGFGSYFQTGEGLLTFSTLEEAADAVAEVSGNYERHRLAARCMAEDVFDSRKVLNRLLDRL